MMRALMRGKKIDNQFVIEFIKKSTLDGKVSKTEIINYAKEQLNIVENKFKEFHFLKKMKSGLEDVLETFKEEKKEDHNIELWLVSNHQEAKEICLDILNRNGNVVYNSIVFNQLINLKIIKKDKNGLIRPGKNYYKYLNNVLKK